MMTPDKTTDTPRSGTNGFREELGRDADRLTGTAKERARDEAEKGKGQAARTAESASSALRSAAGELESDDNAPDWMASAVRQAADKLGRLAGEVDGRSVDEIQQQLSQFARSNPGTFLAASAAAGFAAARVLRAGADHRSHGERQETPGDAGTTSYGDSRRDTQNAGGRADDSAFSVSSAGLGAGGTT